MASSSSTSKYEKELDEASSLSDFLYETRNKYYNYNDAEAAWMLQQKEDWQKTFTSTRNYLVDLCDNLLYALTYASTIANIYHHLTELFTSLEKLKCLVSIEEFDKLIKLDSAPLTCNVRI